MTAPSRTLLALIIGQICLHSCMAGVRMAAPLQVLRQSHSAWAVGVLMGLFAAALTWSIYRQRDPGPRRVPLDRVGLVLLVLFVGAMQICIDKGKELGWLESGEIQILALVAVAMFRRGRWKQVRI